MDIHNSQKRDVLSLSELVLKNGFFLTYLFCACALVHMCTGMYKSQSTCRAQPRQHVSMSQKSTGARLGGTHL